MTTVFESHPKILVGFRDQHKLSDSATVKVSAETSSSTLSTSSSMEKIISDAAQPVEEQQHNSGVPEVPQEVHDAAGEAETRPPLHSFQLPIDLDVIKCSMPSLYKMPSAARHLVSNMFSFLNGSPSPQPGASDKVGAQFSTPQLDRKNRVNGSRRMSDGQTNGVVGKVDRGASNAIQKKPLKLEQHVQLRNRPPSAVHRPTMPSADFIEKYGRIKVKNVERWEPNVYEKELLRRTWSDEFDFLYELGSSIYTYIFDHNPNCKQLFPQLIKYGDNWKDSREFRSQALKFVQTISQVVKNIYHMETLEPYLYGIGQRHCKYADRGFKPEYWEDFQDAMEHSLAEHMNSLADLDSRQRMDAITVWRTLALYIIAHMKAGYFDGLKSINKHPPFA